MAAPELPESLPARHARFLGEAGPAPRPGGPAARPGDVLVSCDVGRLTRVDLGTIERLARLALAARRLGCRLELRGATPELRELLDLAGLTDVLPCGGPSGVEPGR